MDSLDELKRTQEPLIGKMLRMWRVEDNIIYSEYRQEYLDEMEVRPEEQDAQLYHSLEAFGVETLYGINNFEALKHLSREAREWANQDYVVKLIRGYAIIAKNPLSRIVANFFLGLNKTRVPLKVV